MGSSSVINVIVPNTVVNCPGCPQVVLETVNNVVDDTLMRVRRVKYLTTMFNRYIGALADKITDDLEFLVNSIPDPPVIDISGFVEYFTCPLTPLALIEDPSLIANMDPRRLARRIQANYKAYVDRIHRDYDELLRRVNSYEALLLGRRYIKEIQRAFGDFDKFVLRLGLHLGYCQYTRITCPTLYASDQYAFHKLVDEVSDWSFDGVLPSDLDARAHKLMSVLSRAEAKLSQWRTVITVII